MENKKNISLVITFLIIIVFMCIGYIAYDSLVIDKNIKNDKDNQIEKLKTEISSLKNKEEEIETKEVNDTEYVGYYKGTKDNAEYFLALYSGNKAVITNLTMDAQYFLGNYEVKNNQIIVTPEYIVASQSDNKKSTILYDINSDGTLKDLKNDVTLEKTDAKGYNTSTDSSLNGIIIPVED